MKKAILCVLLTLAMSVNAFALEVPTDTVVQNLNGSQQAIKTYTIPPDQDPATLIEDRIRQSALFAGRKPKGHPLSGLRPADLGVEKRRNPVGPGLRPVV